jgi:hypothetical protein
MDATLDQQVFKRVTVQIFPAIIVGHIALWQIKRTGQSGRVAAVGGLVLGARSP